MMYFKMRKEVVILDIEKKYVEDMSEVKIEMR